MQVCCQQTCTDTNCAKTVPASTIAINPAKQHRYILFAQKQFKQLCRYHGQTPSRCPMFEAPLNRSVPTTLAATMPHPTHPYVRTIPSFATITKHDPSTIHAPQGATAARRHMCRAAGIWSQPHPVSSVTHAQATNTAWHNPHPRHVNGPTTVSAALWQGSAYHSGYSTCSLYGHTICY
jgi:hypothetical protein